MSLKPGRVLNLEGLISGIKKSFGDKPKKITSNTLTKNLELHCENVPAPLRVNRYNDDKITQILSNRYM